MSCRPLALAGSSGSWKAGFFPQSERFRKVYPCLLTFSVFSPPRPCEVDVIPYFIDEEIGAHRC